MDGLGKNTDAKTVRHKRLNSKQISTLRFIYQFRFVSSKQIARYNNESNVRLVQKQLKTLADQKLIARQYDKTYRLRGKPAAYYLLPQGARILKSEHDQDPTEPIDLKRIYREKNISEQFIEHCSHIVDIYLELSRLFPKNNLVYRQKSTLNYEKYDYFPHPLPDAYIRIKRAETLKRFFLDIFEEHTPYFVIVRRIKRYIEYKDDGEWDDTGIPFPSILLICASHSTQKRINKRILRELRDSYEEMFFITSTIPEVLMLSHTDKIWHLIDVDSDPSDTPVDLNDLLDIA